MRQPIPTPDLQLAERLFAELARAGADGRGITRMAYGPGEEDAHRRVQAAAAALGLDIRRDAACNLYATLPGERAGPAVVIGSHLDSVPCGGNFDGAAGVLVGLAVVAGFCAAGIRPPCPITVAAFRAEESTWFPASYVGSRAAFGRLRPRELDELRRAGDGRCLGDAISDCGGDPAALSRGCAHLRRQDIRAFLEPHIEQGPWLVAEDRPVGLATGIRGAFRYRQAACIGEWSHSGATPRGVRRDAVQAVAALACRLEEHWLRLEAAGADLAVTLGQFATDPERHAFSKVAGRVDFSLDIRSQSAATLAALEAHLAALVAGIEAARGVEFRLGPRTASEPALMDPQLVDRLAAAAAAEGIAAPRMPCGAGHDAAVFAREGVPTAMLLLRNRNGSHNPDEAMELADLAAAARIATRFCLDPGLA